MGAFADTIAGDTVNQERLVDWIDGGFTEAHAVIVTHFQDMAIAAGQGAQAGVDAWLVYQRAIEDGDQAAADAVLAQVEGWGSTADALGAAAEAAVEHAAEVVEARAQFTESLVGGYREMVETASEAYAEVATAGRPVWCATIREAEDAGWAAWQASYEAQKKLRIKQMGRRGGVCCCAGGCPGRATRTGRPMLPLRPTN